MSIMNFNCQEEIEKALLDKKVLYFEEFEASTGKESCQDMASEFIASLQIEGD